MRRRIPGAAWAKNERWVNRFQGPCWCRSRNRQGLGFALRLKNMVPSRRSSSFVYPSTTREPWVLPKRESTLQPWLLSIWVVRGPAEWEWPLGGFRAPGPHCALQLSSLPLCSHSTGCPRRWQQLGCLSVLVIRVIQFPSAHSAAVYGRRAQPVKPPCLF